MLDPELMVFSGGTVVATGEPPHARIVAELAAVRRAWSPVRYGGTPGCEAY
ncbi:hypothetical protein ACE14D_04420 [Streptomyces sp. Act-28]